MQHEIKFWPGDVVYILFENSIQKVLICNVYVYRTPYYDALSNEIVLASHTCISYAGFFYQEKISDSSIIPEKIKNFSEKELFVTKEELLASL